MIECKEHQQRLDPKLAPYTDNQSTQRQNPMMMSDDEIIIIIDDLCGWKCAMNQCTFNSKYKIHFEKGKLMFNQAYKTNTSNKTSMYIHAYG